MHATNSSLDQYMKNIFSIITLLLLVAAPSSRGQGAIFFNNRSIGNVVAPIYGPNPNAPLMRLSGNATTNAGSVDYTGMPLLSGTGFTAELWGEDPATPGVFTPLAGVSAKVPFRTAATLAGFIQNGAASILIPWVPGPANGSSRFQVRAWDNGGTGLAGTYAEALVAGRAAGVSDNFTSPVIAAPNTPGQIVGFTSFNIIGLIPEPSVLVLGALAGVALLWRRRKVSR